MGHHKLPTAGVQPRHEVSDIFRNFRSQLETMPKSWAKVVNAMVACRTSVLGGHKLECNACEYAEYSYNSCGNRHCPKCQFLTKERWISNRTSELFPVEYFHVVFTIPHEFVPLIFCHDKNKKIGLIEYLGQYTHRIAISNHRIENVTPDGSVTFKYRDSKNNNQTAHMTLPALEFMQRFLGHVLPSGFSRIRHYGFLSSRAKAKALAKARELLKTGEIKPVKDESWKQLMTRITGHDVDQCPQCKSGQMVRVATVIAQHKWRNSSLN